MTREDALSVTPEDYKTERRAVLLERKNKVRAAVYRQALELHNKPQSIAH